MYFLYYLIKHPLLDNIFLGKQIKKTIRKSNQNKVDPAIYSAPSNRFVTRVLDYLHKGGDNQIKV